MAKDAGDATKEAVDKAGKAVDKTVDDAKSKMNSLKKN